MVSLVLIYFIIIKTVKSDTTDNLIEENVLVSVQDISSESNDDNTTSIEEPSNSDEGKNNENHPYSVSVLKKNSFLTQGSLLSTEWVLCDADPLVAFKGLHRILSVRAGSKNYKENGVVVRIKYFEIHPLFNESIVGYDIALIRLAQPLEIGPDIQPISLKFSDSKEDLPFTTFLVPAWRPLNEEAFEEGNRIPSSKEVRKRRILQLLYYPGMNVQNCSKYLEGFQYLDASSIKQIMCLEPKNAFHDPCARDGGAPVIFDSVLWGIISSWVETSCDKHAPVLVTYIASDAVKSWILKTMEDQPTISNEIDTSNTETSTENASEIILEVDV